MVRCELLWYRSCADDDGGRIRTGRRQIRSAGAEADEPVTDAISRAESYRPVLEEIQRIQASAGLDAADNAEAVDGMNTTDSRNRR